MEHEVDLTIIMPSGSKTTLSSPPFTPRLRRERKLQPLPFDKLLELPVELIAVLHRNHRHSIRRLNCVGIAIASDHLGPHYIQHRLQYAIVEHPAGKLQARWWAGSGCLHITKGHALAVHTVAFQDIATSA